MAQTLAIALVVVLVRILMTMKNPQQPMGLSWVCGLQCSSGELAMAENAIVRARIDERTKREAAAALKKIGLTVSDAFRLLLVRVAAEKALPFEPLNPNAETVAAMKAARRGDVVKAGKPDNCSVA
jgi:DNA-damage-inducible protein J